MAAFKSGLSCSSLVFSSEAIKISCTTKTSLFLSFFVCVVYHMTARSDRTKSVESSQRNKRFREVFWTKKYQFWTREMGESTHVKEM